MKIKILLLLIPFFAVFFLSSQNANAFCTYSNPLYATMTPLDKVAFKNCINFYPQSSCDSSCGSIVTGCDGTKIKAKDITSCVAGSPFYPCGWLTNSFQEGYTYTYKDCGGEPVRNKCYGGACVECTSDTDCPASKPNCDLSTHTCYNIAPPPLTACPDGTLENACCTTPGTRCKNDGTGTLACQNDATCPFCTDTDGGKVPGTKGTCKDVSGGVCDWRKGGCTDTCASNGAVNEYYCPSASSACMPTIMPCSSSDVCQYGACGYTPDYGGGGTNPSSGGCSWYSSTFGVCSSGCPASYPNQQQVCCNTIKDRGCNGGPACASYNPIVGETPCCTAGGYQTCTKQEICTQSGCQNVCTGSDKTSDLYCSKCNSCQDGVQNCGETAVDKGGPNCGLPCTVSTVHSYTTPGVYGYNCQCQAYAPSGYYNIQCISLGGCSYGEYGCWWNCQGTHDDFNVASCSDGVQNCGETCVDGGPQCNSYFGKETDNSYPVSFDYTQPAGLSSTRLYTDAASWNCADGIDNDHDCLIDCADPDCASSYACTDKTPPVTTLSLSGKLANGWYAVGTSATLSCQDDISGCKETYYCTDTANACAPSTKYSSAFSIGSSGFVRFYSNDKAKNTEAVKSKEVKIDGNPPSVSVSAAPAAPCTLSPLADWINCPATSYVVCSDGESGCDSGTYMLKSYPSNPGSCPSDYNQYALAASQAISSHVWVCGAAKDGAGNAGFSSPAEFKVDTAPPSTTISLNPAAPNGANGWYVSSVAASVTCSDVGSGCDKLFYTKDSGARWYSVSTSTTPFTYGLSLGDGTYAVQAYSKDKAGNNGAKTPVFPIKVDTAAPSVSVIATPFPPCTLNPLVSWIDCSAAVSVGCSDAVSGCKASAYGYKVFDSNPGTCPSSKSYYASGTATIAGDKWVCVYAEDNAGNGAASMPAEIKVNKTFTITVDAKAYGEIEFSPGMKVDAYLCDASQYYCNHDAQYLAKGSAVVGADKKFKITLVQVLDRGKNYKIGVQTEKGYAESEFVA